MAKIAIILVVLCASLAGNVQAETSDYDFYFINGVWNSKDKAEESQMELNTHLGKQSSKLLWNENDFLLDLYDVYIEKTGEVNNLEYKTTEWWGMIYRFLPFNTKFELSIANWINPTKDVGFWSRKDLARMVSAIKSSLNANKKTVVIAHSQGNFFYRNIWQELNAWDSEKTSDCFAGIGFATPLSSSLIGNYNWITNHNDEVINIVRFAWGGTLPANVTVPENYVSPKFGYDSTGHGLNEIYLAHSSPLDRLKNQNDGLIKQATDLLDSTCKDDNCLTPLGDKGGQGQRQYTYNLTDTTAHTVEISFEAYNIPDRITITANGNTIAQTNGYVSGFHQWQIDYDPDIHGAAFVAHIDAPNGGTKWNLCIDCEGSDCQGQIKRKEVSYSFISTSNWSCSNHKIDGSPASSSGSIKLSTGNHQFYASCVCKDHHSISCNNPELHGYPAVSVSDSSCSVWSSNKGINCNLAYGARTVEIYD